MLGELWRKLRVVVRRREFDRDLEEEMRFHYEMAGRRRFGSLALAQEDARAAWGWTRIEAWIADVRYAARALRKNPGFTAVAALTMALGIGASTAVFSVAHAVLLRPLPFRDPGRLVMLWETREKRGDARVVVSYRNFSDWKEQSRSFERVAVFVGDGVRANPGGEPVLLRGTSASGEFWEALGVQPVLGRAFLPAEYRAGAPKMILLSWALWQRLGADPKIAGRAERFDRELYTVAGVMPRGFSFPDDSEFWTPFAADDSRNEGGNHYLRVIARLKPGVQAAQAQTDMRAVAARLWKDRPEGTDPIGANVVPLMDQIAGEARGGLGVLTGAVACVLLIACGNVANLLLARIGARRRELTLRLSLGASRWRIARGLLAESMLITLAGAAIGTPAAWWLVRGFIALDPIHLPRIHEMEIDGSVLGWALAAALATGLLCGAVPALRGSAAREIRAARGRSALAAAQLAMAMMLLIGAGLLLRSFVARVTVPLGFRPEGVLGVELPWSANRRAPQLLDRLRALPGVESAGAATAFPQDPAGSTCGGCLEIEGRPKTAGSREVGLMVATPGFFETTGMTAKRGRFFTPADGPSASKVAVINEALARRDFPNQDPLGRRVRWGDDWATIVGIARNVKGFGVAGDPMPAIYFPQGQHEWGNGVQVLVRTAVPPASMAAAIRKEIRSWNGRLIIDKFDTLENLMAETVATPRFYMLLIAGFAALALLVAAVGVYGTVNFAVARRTHEIGIRMALGAGRADVLAMVLGQGARLTAAGVALGLGGAWAARRALESLLFGVRASDGVALAGGLAALAASVLLASYLPARRATRVDPAEALRHE